MKLSFWSDFFSKKIPEGSINKEDWDFGYQGIASRILGGSLDGHLN